MSLGRVLVERFPQDVLDWLGERCDIVSVDPWLEPEQWEIEAPQVDAVISRKGKITREHLELSKGRLKLIARTGVGVDPSRVDLDACKQHRVWVTNMPGSNSVSVAELTFGQMINLVRHCMGAHRAVVEGRWSDYMQFLGTELAGKTLGIVGFGNIGTRMAIRARAFEMDFLVTDPYVPDAPVTSLGGQRVPLDELLAESDLVTIHCPLTAETKGMINDRELALMKPTAYILNLARGGIVNEDALYRALKNKTIAGAALDAMVEEPMRGDHPLLHVDNLIFSPHIGAVTVEASSRGEWGAAEEVVRVLEGKPPKNPVINFE